MANKSLKNYFDFLWEMTEREIKARYKRAVFGFLWVILNPLLQMLIIGFIFSFFIKIPNYYLFLFAGLLPWQFFSLSVSKATPSVVHERALLQKAKFPIEAIPVSIILANFFNLLISLILLVLFLLILNLVFWPGILLIFLAFLWLLVFTIGLSLLTSALNVRFRDINFFTQTILILWFYATPVIFNLGLLTEGYRKLFILNPLTSVFELIHYSLLKKGSFNLVLLLSNILISLLIVFAGIVIFNRKKRFFVDWL